jgi:hypothetical protein
MSRPLHRLPNCPAHTGPVGGSGNSVGKVLSPIGSEVCPFYKMPGHSGLLGNYATDSAAKKCRSIRKFNIRPVVIFAPFYFARFCRRGKTNGHGATNYAR